MLGNRVNALAPSFLQRRAERDATARRGRVLVPALAVRHAPAGPIAAASAAFLIALGIPFLEIKFTSPDAQILPEERSARQVDNVLRAEFPRFRDTPIRVLVENATPETVAQVQSRAAGRPKAWSRSIRHGSSRAATQ